jgi:hypothetical protein
VFLRPENCLAMLIQNQTTWLDWDVRFVLPTWNPCINWSCAAPSANPVYRVILGMSSGISIARQYPWLAQEMTFTLSPLEIRAKSGVRQRNVKQKAFEKRNHMHGQFATLALEFKCESVPEIRGGKGSNSVQRLSCIRKDLIMGNCFRASPQFRSL